MLYTLLHHFQCYYLKQGKINKYTMIQNQGIQLLSQPAETPKISRSPPSVISADSQSAQDRLESKIEMMARSLAQVPTLNASKSMQLLKSIQKERQKQEKQQRNICKQLLQDVNAIEKSILVLDRDRMIKNSQHKIAEQEVFRMLNNCENQFRRTREDNHEKLAEFSDKISTTKIAIVEKEEQNRQTISRLQRQTQSKLSSLEKESTFNHNTLDYFHQKFKKDFRAFRTAIEEQMKEAEREIKRQEAKLDSSRVDWNRKLQEEQSKQKLSFQRNYDALEQIFRLMSQE